MQLCVLLFRWPYIIQWGRSIVKYNISNNSKNHYVKQGRAMKKVVTRSCHRLTAALENHVSTNRFQRAKGLPARSRLVRRCRAAECHIHGTVTILTRTNSIFPIQNDNIFIHRSHRNSCLSVNAAHNVSTRCPRHGIASIIRRLSLLRTSSILTGHVRYTRNSRI